MSDVATVAPLDDDEELAVADAEAALEGEPVQDVDLACCPEMARRPVHWRAIEAAFANARRRLPPSGLLSMYGAILWQAFCRDRSRTLAFAREIDRLDSWLDERYFAFTMLRVHDVPDEATGGGGGGADAGAAGEDGGGEGVGYDPIKRITFEHHVHEATLHTQRARHVLELFWRELKHTEPDLDLLYVLAARLHRFIQTAQLHFARALRMAHRSPPLLRSYASFLAEVRARAAVPPVARVPAG